MRIAASKVTLSDEDMKIFRKFSKSVIKVAEYAIERKCVFYLDAEQTFLQDAIESFGQQLAMLYNIGENRYYMANTFQGYLVRVSETVKKEMAVSKILGYNTSIKLVRGAYMVQEREIAQQQGIASPVYNTIEETHAGYD